MMTTNRDSIAGDLRNTSCLGMPMLGFGLMMSRCNPMFRNCLLYQLGLGAPPLCPPPTFMMTRLIANTWQQCPQDSQQAFLLALGVAAPDRTLAETTEAVDASAGSLVARQLTPEMEGFLAGAEEYAQAFETLGMEAQGQTAQTLSGMLTFLKNNPGLKLTLAY